MKKDMELLVATHNQHKKEEIQQILGTDYVVKSLTDYDIHEEIVEDGDSFNANALIKAKYCFEKTGIPSLGDDSGLVVDALDGRPGIFSARYAGDHDFGKNIEKVLSEMEGVENRKAYFITVLCYYDENGAQYFEGRANGNLLTENKGHKGFGYDPIFVPEGYEKTFAEMNPEDKNKISHRKQALDLFLDHLKIAYEQQ
ncbi:non-canonical purine NTP pyrophosphatase, RdgB/HAM1 family [Chryseobacterium sp. T16E-39]|uniref:RdgB/HAM1 family non-canonical purine NTP pyrophosphatase n=1 Tax=Chryseobacterium sp. T16E-39 TaxID=2015076 RepID=UPI000B5B26FC|nr:RdgB/HAM1 family non-canonical purine NTP pyrophosphatase [Chryseobacterium sp. T16E-39]ASK32471.1 non-canonical purine NTP pyrophosphatase, RdgB/HAM1 family [Chryseobacterium sp. T16E-39]